MPVIGGHEITVSHPDKVVFPEDGITKGELCDYYREIAPRMVPHVKERPLHMNRFPDGIGGFAIQQKRVPDSFPDWIKRATVERRQGGAITHAMINDAATLVYLANYNMITAHVWLSRIEAPDRPDQVMFDLDPAGEDFGLVRSTALKLKVLLEEMNLVPFVNRNAYAQTAVAAYSVRARRGAPVAAPVDWSEVEREDLKPDGVTIRNAFGWLGQRDDPWAAIERSRKALPAIPESDRPDRSGRRRGVPRNRGESGATPDGTSS
jgi:DNA primase